MTEAALLVVGIGNEWRGDDGVGPWIVDQLQAMELPGVRLVRSVADGLALLDVWRDAERVYVIDALRDAARPGEVLRVDALRQALPTASNYSSHAFGLPEAIELGRTLGQLPVALIVIGIEGRQFGMGKGLSPEVEAAAQGLVDALREELSELAGKPEGARLHA